MTEADGHEELEAAWDRARSVLLQMPSRLRFSDVYYMDVNEKAERSKSLGLHLDGAVAMMRSQLYGPGFALLRTALEHLVVDWLVFQATTYVRHIQDVSLATWTQWEQARARGEDWTQAIRSWNRTQRGDVRIVFEGLHTEPNTQGRRSQISIYYFLLDQFQPGLGPPSAQLDTGLIALDELREIARDNQGLWHTYLRWSSLLENLRMNELLDQEDIGRLGVHYRFLSGFAHPVTDLRREVYGKDVGLRWPKYDHYSSELILLYAITIAVTEARNFSKSLQTGVAISDEAELIAELVDIDRAAAHFWFLGVNPHDFDVWTARNELAFRSLRAGVALKTLPPEPAASAVPYPRDPLARLVAMHSSSRELTTGLVFDSPWPRSDARFR